MALVHNDKRRASCAAWRREAHRMLDEHLDVAIAKPGFHGSVVVEIHLANSTPSTVKHYRTEAGIIRNLPVDTTI